MGLAGLGKGLDCRTRHHALGHLKVGIGLQQRGDAGVQIVHVRLHDALLLRRSGTRQARDVGNSRHDVQLSPPAVGKPGGYLQGLQSPLRLVRSDRHAPDLIVQVHQVPVIVGIGHDHNRAVGVGGQA